MFRDGGEKDMEEERADGGMERIEKGHSGTGGIGWLDHRGRQDDDGN